MFLMEIVTAMVLKSVFGKHGTLLFEHFNLIYGQQGEYHIIFSVLINFI